MAVLRAMRCGISAGALATLVVVAAVGDVALASRPTKANCVRAWNAPANRANQELARSLGGTRGSIGAGESYSFSWGGGQPPHSTPAQLVCMLSLGRGGHPTLALIGSWRHGSVRSWRRRAVSISRWPPNVRVTNAGTLRVVG